MPTPEKANSVMLVRPITAPPAARSRATATAHRRSRAAHASSSTTEPAVVASPSHVEQVLDRHRPAPPAAAPAGTLLAPRPPAASNRACDRTKTYAQAGPVTQQTAMARTAAISSGAPWSGRTGWLAGWRGGQAAWFLGRARARGPVLESSAGVILLARLAYARGVRRKCGKANREFRPPRGETHPQTRPLSMLRHIPLRFRAGF